MGAFLLAAGAKGKRFALPNSTVMIHQPSGGFQGQVSDIERHAQFVIDLKRRFITLMAKFTGPHASSRSSATTTVTTFLMGRSSQGIRNRRPGLAKRAQGA